jgi:hypothetical protein
MTALQIIDHENGSVARRYSNCSCESTEDRNAGTDTPSSVHTEPTAENADLFARGPPEYTQEVTSGEISVDAKAIRTEKAQTEDRSPAYDTTPSQPLAPQDSNTHNEERTRHGEYEYHIHQDGSEQEVPSPTRSMNAPASIHHFTEPVVPASLASVRACSIFGDRPAVWLVKQKSAALSPFAAAVLTKEGHIQAKDLQLYVAHVYSRGKLELTPLQHLSTPRHESRPHRSGIRCVSNHLRRR